MARNVTYWCLVLLVCVYEWMGESAHTGKTTVPAVNDISYLTHHTRGDDKCTTWSWVKVLLYTIMNGPWLYYLRIWMKRRPDLLFPIMFQSNVIICLWMNLCSVCQWWVTGWIVSPLIGEISGQFGLWPVFWLWIELCRGVNSEPITRTILCLWSLH
jgi:hypothetical protein